MSKNQAPAASATPLTSFAPAASASLAAGTPASDSRRIQTRKSGVHGKGVFALQDLAEGETLIEYVGEVINWTEALRRHPHDPKDPNHTFYFHIDEDHVIDAKHDGNSSRWINHSCKPNCEADEDGGRVFIKALRNIKAGEELFYDYGLIIDAKYTPKLLAEYPCWCGARRCRGTLLAPKDKAGKTGKGDKKKKDPKKSAQKADARPVSKADLKASKKADTKPVRSAKASAEKSAEKPGKKAGKPKGAKGSKGRKD